MNDMYSLKRTRLKGISEKYQQAFFTTFCYTCLWLQNVARSSSKDWHRNQNILKRKSCSPLVKRLVGFPSQLKSICYCKIFFKYILKTAELLLTEKSWELVIQSFTVLHPESGFVVLLTCEWRFRSLPTAFLFWAADFVFYTSQGLSVCYFKSLSEVFIKRRQWRHTIVSSWFKILYSLYSLKDRRLVLHNLLRVNRRGMMCRWSESQHIENLFLDKCHYRWYG